MRLLLSTAVAAGAKLILIIEDDEWYSPYYVEKMVELLQHWPLVGEGKAKYYCIKNRTWRIYDNIDYACLCRTGLNADYAEALMQHFEDYSDNVDKHFWRTTGQQGKVVFDVDLSVGQDLRTATRFPCSVITKLQHIVVGVPKKHTFCVSPVGIKGMPGRLGISRAHQGHKSYVQDPEMSQLAEWIGEDANRMPPFMPPPPPGVMAGGGCFNELVAMVVFV